MATKGMTALEDSFFSIWNNFAFILTIGICGDSEFRVSLILYRMTDTIYAVQYETFILRRALGDTFR